MSLVESTSGKVRSFWSRPEGKTGGLMLLGVCGIAAWGLALLAPYLTVLFTNLLIMFGFGIAATIAGVVFAGLLLTVTNHRFLVVSSYMFRSVARVITGAFIEIDPIGIMQNYIEDLKAKSKVIENGISKLSGQIRICQDAVNSNAQKQQAALAYAGKAREKGNESLFAVQARQAGRLKKSNVTLTEVLTSMQNHLRILRKYKDVAETVIADMENEVDVRRQERAVINASYSVMKSVRSILKGDPDKKELFDRAMQTTVEDYGQKLGEIEDFVDSTKSIIDGFDMQNGIYEEDALKSITAWENKADQLLLPKSAEPLPALSGPASTSDLTRFLNP